MCVCARACVHMLVCVVDRHHSAKSRWKVSHLRGRGRTTLCWFSVGSKILACECYDPVPETSFKGGAIRATVERFRVPFFGRRQQSPREQKVPGWSDLRPVVEDLMSAGDAAAMADVKVDSCIAWLRLFVFLRGGVVDRMLTLSGLGLLQAEYTQRDDDETDYLQARLREKWRLKAKAKKNVKVKYSADEALDQMASLISEGDYGGVRALLRDTIEDSPVFQVLLGYSPVAGADTKSGESGAPRQVPLLQAADQGNREIVEALMQAGANARARDPQGRTASQVMLPACLCPSPSSHASYLTSAAVCAVHP